VRLSQSTLALLPPSVQIPAYAREQVRCGVVHLGIGAFHRAHQAVLFERALASGDLRWGITGVSLRSSSVRDQLGPQDGLYTLVERDGDAERLQVIGAVQEVLVAPDDPERIVRALASPDVHIVTLTVTEKGYRLDPATASLLEHEPDVAADLRSPASPRTVPGFLVAALARRRSEGTPAFTAISCDNLPDNGGRLRAAVLAMARAHDTGLADWIASEGAFPNTMVDRIVPATTNADRDALARLTGLDDQGMVKTEPFLQWVIEDRFAGAHPDFAALGAQVTNDVAPWEEAKLRLLNGAHSAMAYLGGLAGIECVDAFVARSEGRRFVEALWDEAAATLKPPPELDIAAYRTALMARFGNTALAHRTRQIAIDGSQKLPQRLVAPLLERRQGGFASEALTLAIAAWMRWQSGVDDAGMPFTVEDPLAERTRAALSSATSAEARVRALLAINAIFPTALTCDAVIAGALSDSLERLEGDGAWESVRRAAERRPSQG
jgi:fructuronate reductase